MVQLFISYYLLPHRQAASNSKFNKWTANVNPYDVRNEWMNEWLRTKSNFVFAIVLLAGLVWIDTFIACVIFWGKTKQKQFKRVSSIASGRKRKLKLLHWPIGTNPLKTAVHALHHSSKVIRNFSRLSTLQGNYWNYSFIIINVERLKLENKSISHLNRQTM